MKIGSFEHDGNAHYGVFTDDGIVDLVSRLGQRYPDLLSLLRAGALAEARAASQNQPPDFSPAEIRFQPVIPAPVNIYCTGINYLDHLEEMGRERPEYPTLFMKLGQSLVGHDAEIVKPMVSDCFDYEAELCVILGKGGRHIDTSAALDHVAGYTCLLDGSIRDFQARAVDQGKNFHHSSSVGPWLVTPDEMSDWGETRIQGRLNGTVMQNSTIDKLLFTVEDLIAYYSQIAELRPGDMISTGTCGGVGHGRTPPVYMQKGDVFEIEITGIGILRNTVIDEQPPG